MEPVASQTAPAAARPRALQASTLCEAFQATAADFAERPALRLKDSDYECSWAEYAQTVARRAAGLAALGVGRGDTVGFMLVNRPALHLTDAAAMHLGATCFSVYNTSSPEQIEYLLGDAANRVLVTEQAFLERVLPLRDRVPSLEHVIVVDPPSRGAGGEAPEGGLTLEQLEARGEPDFDFDSAWRAVEPDDVLCLIYTSGTTGPPKGVQLTHGNLMSEWRALDPVVPASPGGRTISFLPSAHIADRWSQLYGSMVYGHTVHCCPEPREMVAYSIEVKPTFWGGVPRIWEKLKTALEAGFAGEQDAEKRSETARALEVGVRYAEARQEGSVPPELEAEWKEADELVFVAIRTILGLHEVEYFLVGAAPTPPEVLLFFDALGIEILELWGLSETSAVATINPSGAARAGTVGKPLPGVEVVLAEDGEVKVRGPIVMKGYRNMPDKTAEAFDAEGWFLTGDVGEFDDDGYLRIVDRKKELIINAAGKNMSPANIEAKIKAADGIVAQAVAIGDRRPYNVALIVLDPEVAATVSEEEAERRVAEAVEKANSRLSRVEQIKKFHIVPGEWLPGGDELTPTMKLKRKPIAEKYVDEIDALYSD